VSPHGHRDKDESRIDCAVVTVSDTRTEADDTSGRRIRELLEERGHAVAFYRIVRDEPELVERLFDELPASVRAVIFNGGTGLARRDTTYEALARLLEKEITGFGEIFRMLSYQEIGPAAMLSRATAGVVAGRAVFSVPGSTKAVELAMTKLVLPELGHIVALVSA
jgi:molybdenum cofactor biosynthesis protein B